VTDTQPTQYQPGTRRKVTPSNAPQRGPALALVALLSEHKDLPAIEWGLTSEGHLFGTAHDPVAFAAYAEVLGGKPMGPIQFKSPSGGFGTCDQLFATWQDVEFSLAGLYSTHPGQVAA
jgi:hypothetical protein